MTFEGRGKIKVSSASGKNSRPLLAKVGIRNAGGRWRWIRREYKFASLEAGYQARSQNISRDALAPGSKGRYAAKEPWASAQRLMRNPLRPLPQAGEVTLGELKRTGVILHSKYCCRPLLIRSLVQSRARKRGQVQFVRSTLRAVPANWTCPLFRAWLEAGNQALSQNISRDALARISHQCYCARPPCMR